MHLSEREYAGCKHGLLATRPLPYPPYVTRLHRTLPFKGIGSEAVNAEGRRHRRPQDSERVPCRPIVCVAHLARAAAPRGLRRLARRPGAGHPADTFCTWRLGPGRTARIVGGHNPGTSVALDSSACT